MQRVIFQRRLPRGGACCTTALLRGGPLIMVAGAGSLPSTAGFMKTLKTMLLKKVRMRRATAEYAKYDPEISGISSLVLRLLIISLSNLGTEIFIKFKASHVIS